MLKYGIPDLRTFFDGDVRWLQHYGFEPHLLPSLVRGALTHEIHPGLAQRAPRHRCRPAGCDRQADRRGAGAGRNRSKALWRPFVVAKVISAEQHPNADKLRVCKVDPGDGTLYNVVCGAPNARTGLVSVFAPRGHAHSRARTSRSSSAPSAASGPRACCARKRSS